VLHVAPRLFLRFLLLLLGGFYLGSVCELDAAECGQHYAQETHEHIVARLGVDVVAPAALPDKGPAAWRGHQTGPTTRPLFRSRAGLPAAWPWVANPPPPVRRLYLRYAVLRV